jgi:glycosyltransferase involved in cell wall biosynthesis
VSASGKISPGLPVGYDRASWRRALGVADDDVLLCYFGFLNESKGGETLLRSLAELRHRGQRARLLMVGGQVGDSDPTNRVYLERIRRLANELMLGGSVLWTGFGPKEQVSAHFRAADICVLPYRDGASYRRGSFMAALAHGLPIVSTQPKVSIATLIHGENIFLVPPDDAAAVADAVEQVVGAPALRSRLAAGALELAKQFAWDTIATQTARLYAQLVAA